MPKHATIVAVNKHLHPVRLATYTARCGNDPFRALELYKWNLQLRIALHKTYGRPAERRRARRRIHLR